MLADWQPEHRPQPWGQLLNACAQHDHGWMEEQFDPLLDTQGELLDFLSLPFDVTLDIAQRNLQNAESQSRWCAVLVARHVEYLFRGKDDRQAREALAELQGRRAAWMQDLGVEAPQVEELYELLCWADTFSLLVCCPPSDFTRSLQLTAQGLSFEAHDNGKGRWSLSPWPYRQNSLQLSYETRRLPEDSFSSLEEFRQALRSASVLERSFLLEPEVK